IRQDQILRASPTPSAVAQVATPTLTLEPTPTPTFVPSDLEVSAGGPYSGEEGSQIALVAENTSSVLGLVPGVITYLWDLDNDGQYDDANGASTPLTFYDEGEYTISVQATDLLGRVGIDTTTVVVSNVPPLVKINQDVQANEGEEVVFAATASDPGRDILFYEWDFNDGSPLVRDTLNPSHTFANNDSYMVRLWVRDNDGGVSEDFLLAEVENLPPLVDAGSDQTSNEGSQVNFSGQATDPGGLDQLSYAWDFNYDGQTFTSDATGPTASFVYPNGPIVAIAALRVKDEDGGQAIDTVEVRVNNVPPVITGVSDDGPVGEGSSLSLTVSATDVGQDPLTYAFDWQNNGSFDAVGQPETVSNIWYNQGDYTVRIRVDDGDGGQAFTTTTVSAFNEPPVAIASAATNLLEGSPVPFDGSDSSDPGLQDVLAYQWNLGDGSSASGINVTHAYADNGVYSATLTVTDDSGDVGTAAVSVNIFDANPTANAGPDLTIDECRKNSNNYECTNVPVNFSGTATDPGTADILTYGWDFDNDGSFAEAAGATGTYSYPSLDGPKDYVVTLRVRDDDYNPNPSSGNEIGEAFDTLKLTVRNLPPWNVNAGGPYQGIETKPVLLTATAQDAPADAPTLEYAWDLNSNPDFETSGNRVSHRWNNAGVYTIRLRVRDKDGGETIVPAQVEIGNAPPLAEANGPYTSTIAMPVTLSAAGSSDPTGQPLTYHWNFGDGITETTTNITTTHLYGDDGVYTATLQVNDGQPGGTDTDTALVTINNLPPTAIASANPTSVTKGVPVTFDGSGSSDPDDPPASLTYQWDFGDGNSANGINVNHPYANQGNYTATLTVIDDNGATNTASVSVSVSNSPPTANAGPDQTVNEGNQAIFDGSGSSDPNGDPLTFQWDFGDGSPIDTRPNPDHTYADGPATYNVTQTVTDIDGAIATDTAQITVDNVAPTANAGSDQTVSEGSQVNFNGSGSSDPGADTLSYQWDFGDGNSSTEVNPIHTYPDGPATYNVTLTVTDSDGAVGSHTIVVTVNNELPQNVDAGGP
ncbi:MAG TPA: PKD domain-containing protein, partial [Anaerolineae bacterium]|nr:PKD domain-containing protein [Anaerolineae bacterium]